MKDSEDLAGYLRYADGALKDSLLSEKEWHVMMEAVPSYGLSVQEAQRLLIERCVERDAVIEHFEIENLRDLIAIATGDGVLEARVQELLQSHLERRYSCANLASPQAHVASILGKQVDEARVHEELSLRKKIRDRLIAAAGAGLQLRAEDWRHLYRELTKELETTVDQADDYVDLFLDCRRELEIEIAEPSSAGLEAKPEPETGLRPGNPEHPIDKPIQQELEPDPLLRLWVFLRRLGLVLIAALVAVLVFLLMSRGRVFGSDMESSAGSAVELLAPECDDECLAALKARVEGLAANPLREGGLDRLVEVCAPYLWRPEEIREAAKAKLPEWKACEEQTIVEEFERRSGQDEVGQ